MDNQLREFEELLLDNALLKVQNQALVEKNPKWEKLWQTIHEIMEEQIQDNIKIVYANEKAYLNELLAYQLQFEGYTYDQLSNKLVEVPFNVF
jgi:UDP-galactopyranose mutase